MTLICSFLWMSYFSLYICTIFFIYSSVNGHFSCFHVLAIMNSAAMNVEVHVSFWIIVNGYPLQYSCRQNFMHRGAWWVTVHGITESDMTERLTLSLCPDTCPEVGLLDQMVILFLVFGGTSILFSIVTVPTYIPANSVGGFPFFFHTVSSICRVLHDGHYDGCEGSIVCFCF